MWDQACSLCASQSQNDDVSCQLVSPYGGSHALVVYCDTAMCQMPVLARDDQLVISAVWRRQAADAPALGPAIEAKIQSVFVLLGKQFSGF